jgi:peptidoglycan/LPS O-acetylase OafA/YrhL
MVDAVVRRHGGLGILSFVIGVLSFVLLLGLVGAAFYFVQGGQQSADTDTLLTYGIIVTVCACLLGNALGIASALSRRSKKALPITGIILCTTIIVVIAGLIVLGLRQGAG